MKKRTMTKKRKRTIRKIIRTLSKIANYSVVIGILFMVEFYALVGFLTVDRSIERLLVWPFLIIVSPFVIKIMIRNFRSLKKH